MEIFIRGIPAQASEKNLRDFLAPHIRGFGITVFHCHKFSRKPLATLTFLDIRNGTRFLDKLENCLSFMGRTLKMTKSRHEAKALFIRSLEMEADDRQALSNTPREDEDISSIQRRKFAYTGLSCGQWDYDDEEIFFYSQFSTAHSGNLLFGKKTLIATSKAHEDVSNTYQLLFPYTTIQSITIGNAADPSITISISEAPRVYEQSALQKIFEALDINQTQYNDKRVRVSGLNKDHEAIIASCLVYRVKLDDGTSLTLLSRLCNGSGGTPACISYPTQSLQGTKLRIQRDDLTANLDKLYMHFDFPIRFQVQRLVQNGFLTKRQTLSILPAIDKIYKVSGSLICADAIRRMSIRVPFSGPENDSAVFDRHGLNRLLLDSKLEGEQQKFYGSEPVADQAHVQPIHRILVTPTGEYLEGPDPETINRVLRSYPSQTDHFVRVVFCEEDFEQLRLERLVSLRRIRERFQGLLDGRLSVAGRKYEFLGFSHSSLRNQSCWFMASIQEGNVSTNAAAVIAGLGDFSKIRVPARCAARIGQAFSDTTSSVPISPEAVTIVEDVEFNGRCFSDGVGTVSYAVLQKIWDGHPSSAPFRPKLYQIRYAGAKGMISLDTRLKGDVLKLRKSMIKFEGSPSSNIEVCGSSARSLPMYLNRQYIKIMEDLGVPGDVFLGLQRNAVNKLSVIMANSFSAADFLKREGVCIASGTSGLIKDLSKRRFDFRDDPFLRGIVELAVLSQLRGIKYRARIAVDDAATLYGIMDETDTLSESEVFCQVNGRIIIGKVMVTRSPALHPGDIQMANAVDVPEDSPLRSLRNCVLFSQRGERDLPSQLGGGDLDGDEYSVVWNPLLHPSRTVQAADYPRAEAKEIQRPVTREDMTKFFLDFFEADQLGRIATLHMQLADTLSTEHSDCKDLAELHSTAVDFSKTGIPADQSKIPKYTPSRPDFMAPNPRVKIEDEAALFEPGEELNGIGARDSDLEEEVELEGPPMRYYKSSQILGELYREIDEREFLAKLQSQSRSLSTTSRRGSSLAARLWAHVLQETLGVQWQHYQAWARDIKRSYESQLLDTMHQYSPHPSQIISEEEVFSGTLLGRSNGAISRRAREANKDMKERFDRDVTFTITCIKQGPDWEAEERSDVLPRAMACLSVARETEKILHLRKMRSQLRSFRYVAAAVCLNEIQKRDGR